ncbi:unnamed protein product [Ectocarpus sp. CCAP 1310/34]|nr:unnamed protein product [Ectocarpus sp. CCAP 1310/34]
MESDNLGEKVWHSLPAGYAGHMERVRSCYVEEALYIACSVRPLYVQSVTSSCTL